MKISLEILQLLELLICYVQDEAICSALHISTLEKRYLNSLYSIHRFIGICFRNELIISVVLFYMKYLKILIGNIQSLPCFEILHLDHDLLYSHHITLHA